MRRSVQSILAASAVAVLAVAAPAAAQEAPGYAVSGVGQSRANYTYLTVDSVRAKLRPAIAAQLPAAADSRLVILNANFRAAGRSDKMVRLDPADLQVQWVAADGARGAAPVVGVHYAKESISWAGGGGAFTSMRPDRYELVAIVPRAVRAIDLALRAADGSYKTVKANIPLK